MNYYIGFENYSTSLIALQQVVLERIPSGLYKAEYRAVVRLTFKLDGKFVDGVGSSTHEAADRGEVIWYCKKNAVTDARKAAFSLLAIVLLIHQQQDTNNADNFNQPAQPSFRFKATLHFLDRELADWEPLPPPEPCLYPQPKRARKIWKQTPKENNTS